MNILIFGGSGFLGIEIKKLLKKHNFNCLTASFNSSKSDFKIDISKIESFKFLPNNYFNIIINCATILPGKDFLDSDNLDKTYKTNILGTQNICNWIRTQSSVKKIINSSTLIVNKKPWKLSISEKDESYYFGNHIVYSSSKLFQELFFKTFCLKYAIPLVQIRFSALYGKDMQRNGLIWNLINEIKTINQIKLNSNSKRITIDYLNVIDAARIILSSVEDKNAIGIINGASGKEISIFNLALIIKECYKNKSDVIIGDTLDVDNYEDRSKVSVEKLKKIINLDTFITIKEGIKELIALPN